MGLGSEVPRDDGITRHSVFDEWTECRMLIDRAQEQKPLASSEADLERIHSLHGEAWRDLEPEVIPTGR